MVDDALSYEQTLEALLGFGDQPVAIHVTSDNVAGACVLAGVLLRVKVDLLTERSDAELVALHLAGVPRPFVFFERCEFVRSEWVMGARTDLAITLCGGTVRIEDTSASAVVRRYERRAGLALLEDDPDTRERAFAHLATLIQKTAERSDQPQVTVGLAPLAAYLAARCEGDEDMPF
jgi:hypothetical protein